MTLEDLIKFLAEKGIEVPKDSTADQVITIIQTLLSGDEEEEDTKKPNDEEKTDDVPMGVA